MSISTGPSLSPDDALRLRQAVMLSARPDACARCRWLDGKVIAVGHPDLERLRPPLASGCRSLWVYITKREQGVQYDQVDLGQVPPVGPPCEAFRRPTWWQRLLKW